METIRNILSAAFESYLVRVAVVCVSLGAIPFYLLSLAMAQVSK